jgi:transposase InsO family protein
VLHEQALPFYCKHGLEVDAVIMDNGREFCGMETHPYELLLALNDIEHRRTPIGHPQSNGFVERFNRTAKEEFFMPALKRKVYQSIDDLQEDLEEWLASHNAERPHLGYQNMSACPIQTVLSFSSIVRAAQYSQ